MTTISDILEKFYADHEVKPYISPERDLEAWLLDPKPVSKRNMELLRDGLQGISFSCGGSILEPLRQRLGFLSTSNILMGFMRRNTWRFWWIRAMLLLNQPLIHWTISMRLWKKPFSKRRESRGCPRWKRPIWTKLWLITLPKKSWHKSSQFGAISWRKKENKRWKSIKPSSTVTQRKIYK